MEFIGQIHNRWVGFSTETKPTGPDVPPGSIFDELDKRRRWIYYDGVWYEDFTNDVFIQDQHSPTVIVPLNKTENITSLNFPTSIDDKVISVANAVGFEQGKFVSLTNIANNRYYTGEVVSVDVQDITLDNLIDFDYPTADTVVTQGTHAMNVDGSVTPQIFSLRASDPGLPVTIDITRIIISMTCDSLVDLSKFGDIAGGLTHGLMFRRVDGAYNNIANFKTNQDIAGVMFDWTPYAAANPVQGIDGFVSRMTFAGQPKMGVTVRVGPGQDFQGIVQDPLQSILTFKIMVEGHVVI